MYGKEPKPFEKINIKKLKRTHLSPGEWIGFTESGDAIYILAAPTKIMYTIAKTVYQALLNVKNEDFGVERNTSIGGKGLTNKDMCEIMGIDLSIVKGIGT